MHLRTARWRIQGAPTRVASRGTALHWPRDVLTPTPRFNQLRCSSSARASPAPRLRLQNMASRCAAHVWIAFACISGNGFTRASARQHACAMVAQTNSRTETDGVSSWQMIKTDDSDAVSRSSCSIEPYDLAVESSAYVDRGVTFVGTQMPRFSWKLRASGTQVTSTFPQTDLCTFFACCISTLCSTKCCHADPAFVAR